MSCDNGGPAYPSSNKLRVGDLVSNGHTGMSLRDYFASKAMQAAATNESGANGFTFEQRAEWSYQQADAMLKARQQ